MIQNTSTPHGPCAATPVDTTAFAAFGMREVNGETIDAVIAAAGDDLVCVFFWGVDCFNCEMAKKAMLAQPAAVRELGLRWLHANVYAHPELGPALWPAWHSGVHVLPPWQEAWPGDRLARPRAVCRCRCQCAQQAGWQAARLRQRVDHDHADAYADGCGLPRCFVFPCRTPQARAAHPAARRPGDDRGPCRRPAVVIVPLRHVAAGPPHRCSESNPRRLARCPPASMPLHGPGRPVGSGSA